MRTFDADVVMSYTPYYSGVEQLELANTFPLEHLLAMAKAARFRPRVLKEVDLSFRSVPE